MAPGRGRLILILELASRHRGLGLELLAVQASMTLGPVAVCSQR